MRAEQATSRSGVARRVGRYVIFDEIASGGMAMVHLGRLRGSAGFARTVAIKRLHAQFARDPEFVSMFTDEARLAARIRHPNVAATLDVVTASGELFLVMEYIHGESLAKLIRNATKREERVPLPIAVAIVMGTLLGLHAAHEATNEAGEALGVVHRDISPQNVMVGTDGVARVLDFGVAKAVGRLQTTREGEVKGKTAYMSPEQLRGTVDRRADVYAASVVLWETLTGRRLFLADSAPEVLVKVLAGATAPPSRYAPDVPPALDAIVMRGLARDPSARFATAMEMAVALERTIVAPTPREIGAWVEATARDVLSARAARLKHIEQYGSDVGSDAEIEDAVSALSTLPFAEQTTGVLPSQVSTISVASQVTGAGPARRWQVLAVLATGFAAVAFGWGASRTMREEKREVLTAPPASAVSAPAPSALAAASASSFTSPSPSSSTSTSTSTSASASASASTEVEADAAASAAAGRPTAVDAGGEPKTKARRRSTPSKAAPSKSHCDPPFVIDADGIHIPKPECG